MTLTQRYRFVYKPLVFTEEEEYEPTDDVYLVDDDTVYEEEVALDSPDNITIISQRVIRSVGGGQVVEVTIEVDDVPGADNYELRVTAL